MIEKLKTTRRRFVSAGVAAGGVAALATCGLRAEEKGCVLHAEQEVGPFYVAGELVRRRIAEDRAGIPLRLRLVVLDSRTCTPLKGAAIDLWHCDAMGLYSGYTEAKLGPPPEGGGGGRPPGPPGGFGEGGPPPGVPPVGGFGPGGPGGGMKPTDKLTFLRGIQLTDGAGAAEFETVFPGFYEGRTNHVHFKVRLERHRAGDRYEAGHTSHVGQVFFPEDWNVKLMAQAPYAKHAIHRTTEAEDGVFNGQGGRASVATLLPVNAAKPEMGLMAELRVSVDPTATPAPVGAGGGLPGRGERGQPRG